MQAFREFPVEARQLLLLVTFRRSAEWSRTTDDSTSSTEARQLGDLFKGHGLRATWYENLELKRQAGLLLV